MNLVQLLNGATRRVALVDEPSLRLLVGVESIYALVWKALEDRVPLSALIARLVGDERLDYNAVYDGRLPWRLLAPIDHPEDAAHLLISGTGLTHLGSAANRQAMHGKTDAELTDSMRMFRRGVEAGRPAPGSVGVSPEWFYKGTGAMLRGPGDALDVPDYASDGGEEAEVAGVYVIDRSGHPCRVGMAAGNEFSDHQFEKQNYLNLASSKLRTCALGPELAIKPAFGVVHGDVSIERGHTPIWQKAIATGADEMVHSLENIEHHHFKFEGHRVPGDVHVHYFGAHSLSFGDGVALQDGDVMVVRFDGFGRPLRNPVRVATRAERLVAVRPLA
jgi:hypothetical protein